MANETEPESTGQNRQLLARREFHLFAGTSQGPRISVVSTVRSFRHAARDNVTETDTVLEIGCSTGETTEILAKTGAKIVAVDISAQLIERTAAAMKPYANVTVVRVDARNVPSLVKLIPHPDMLFIDVGGKAQVDSAAFVLRQCLLAFTPRQCVVRNTELAAILSMIERVEIPLKEDWPFAPMSTGDESQMRLENLLAVSRSAHTDSRAFAVKQLRHYPTVPQAVERLREMLEDPQPRVRRSANRAVMEIENILTGTPEIAGKTQD